jgi:hypothetical protein
MDSTEPVSILSLFGLAKLGLQGFHSSPAILYVYIFYLYSIYDVLEFPCRALFFKRESEPMAYQLFASKITELRYLIQDAHPRM